MSLKLSEKLSSAGDTLFLKKLLSILSLILKTLQPESPLKK